MREDYEQRTKELMDMDKAEALQHEADKAGYKAEVEMYKEMEGSVVRAAPPPGGEQQRNTDTPTHTRTHSATQLAGNAARPRPH